MRKLLVLCCCLLFVACSSNTLTPPQADGCKSEKPGCFTVEVFGVSNTEHPLLAGVRAGRARIHEAALPVYQAAKAGSLTFYPGPLTATIYLFNSNAGAMDGATAYENPHGGNRVAYTATRLSTREIPPLAESLPTPSAVYRITAVGKAAMLAIPDAAFTPDTEILICYSGVETLVPSSTRQQGVWIPKTALPRHHADGKTWAMTFAVAR